MLSSTQQAWSCPEKPSNKFRKNSKLCFRGRIHRRKSSSACKITATGPFHLCTAWSATSSTSTSRSGDSSAIYVKGPSLNGNTWWSTSTRTPSKTLTFAELTAAKKYSNRSRGSASTVSSAISTAARSEATPRRRSRSLRLQKLQTRALRPTSPNKSLQKMEAAWPKTNQASWSITLLATQRLTQSLRATSRRRIGTRIRSSPANWALASPRILKPTEWAASLKLIRAALRALRTRSSFTWTKNPKLLVMYEERQPKLPRSEDLPEWQSSFLRLLWPCIDSVLTEVCFFIITFKTPSWLS